MDKWLILLILLGLYMFITRRRSPTSGSTLPPAAPPPALPMDEQSPLPEPPTTPTASTNTGNTSRICQNGLCHTYEGPTNVTCLNGNCQQSSAVVANVARI